MIYDYSTSEAAYLNTTPPAQVIVESSTPHSGPFSGMRGLAAKYFNLDEFTNKLKNINRQTSSSKCAKSIRIALQSAGAKIQSHPVAASDWGNTLLSLGYRQIKPSFDQPKEGDIYIIHRTQKHKYGHIAGYSGQNWVSDFKQRSHDVYKDKNVSYSYFRLPQ
ncbi:hypothetical protein GCM10023206_08720 [Acinetobacter puyangensis]|uniref:CHAP domain-containing protein n=1 Tax=Acinetobacter puyangensis TaxID=1096779 RepID=A0A240ECU4_9GAMM|nr:hypothetical protein [Acinetobacter puyangensis]SNX46376.1 hypothetical protein SAMN05421731_11125 [Acinetobacter puyangensis]